MALGVDVAQHIKYNGPSHTRSLEEKVGKEERKGEGRMSWRRREKLKA